MATQLPSAAKEIFCQVKADRAAQVQVVIKAANANVVAWGIRIPIGSEMSFREFGVSIIALRGELSPEPGSALPAGLD